MFCSKCGKTLTLEDLKCPHCGSPVGQSRFAGSAYTSAQAHIVSDAPAEAAAAYTKTTYTTMTEEEKQEGAVDSRTTYRPVYEGGSAPEEVRKDMRAAVEAVDATAAEAEAPSKPQATLEDLSEEALNTLNAVDEELQMEQVDTSDLHSRPIETTGRAGISAEVEEYARRLEEREATKEAGQGRRAVRRRRSAVVPIADGVREESEAADAYDLPAEEQEPYSGDGPYDGEDAYDAVDEDEYDEINYGRTIGMKDVLKVAAIMLLAAALIVGGVLIFRNLPSRIATSTIPGVTESLYDDGLAAVKAHTESAYVNELINVYRSETITGFTQRVTQDSAAIDALLPEEPAENDSLFVSALQSIQSNIGNAILMDAVESEQGTATDNSEASASRWAIVNNAISQLQAASTAQDLTAIMNGEQITAATTATPEPTPKATYAALVKDDKSEAVLEMQNRLYILGFLLDDRDGAFGSKTQTAVKAFQQAAGLPVTGIADNETLTLLYSEDAPRTQYAQVTPTPRPTDTPVPTQAPEAAAEGDGETGEV